MAALFRKQTSRHEVVSDEELIQHLGEEIPWMGEEPFLVTMTKHPPRPVIEDLEYVRRILISWLAGRPASEVAKRAGCSERTVRNVIAQVVYTREEDIGAAWRRWCDLGLAGGIYLPEDEQSGRARQRYRSGEVIIVVCQVCHRKAGRMRMYFPLDTERGSLLIDRQTLLRGTDLRDGTTVREAGIVQGHLMCHFQVGKDPIRKPVFDRWVGARLRIGTASREDRYRLAMSRRKRHLSPHFPDQLESR